MKKVKKVEILFENCDFATLDIKEFDGLYICDVVKNCYINGSNENNNTVGAIEEDLVARNVCFIIKKEAAEKRFSGVSYFGEMPGDDEMTVAERFIKIHDVVSIGIYYEDNDSNTADVIYTVVGWDDYMYNEFQTAYIVENGDLEVTIADRRAK